MTSSPLTVGSTGRRFVLLTALRWLPLGISIPVTVLLATSRGLSPADVGLVFIAHGVVALLLELPTGGLADAIGRRPVLVLSILLQIAGLLTLTLAQDLPTFAVAFSLVGAGRALDSGPLESWYVDSVHQLDPGADVTPGLARAAVANGAGLALGAIVGGLAPGLIARAGTGSDVLAVPFLIATAIDLVYLVAVLALVSPLGSRDATSAITAIYLGVLAVPGIVRDTMRLSARDPVLRRLLMITFLVGTVLSTLEVIGPLRFAELTGSRTQGTAAFGLVMAASFSAAALGAALATTAKRIARGSVAMATAALFTVTATATSAVALAPVVSAAGIAYVAFYFANAAGWPLRQQLMHARVEAAQRSTTVSAMSFALMTGGITSNLLVPRLAEATSLTTALWVPAGPLVIAALLCLRLSRPATSPKVSTTDGPAGQGAWR